MFWDELEKKEMKSKIEDVHREGWRVKWWEIVGLLAALIVIFLALYFTDLEEAHGAEAINTVDVLYDIESTVGSPLSSVAYTPVAFWRGHRDFDIAGWLAVVWAETNLARDGFARRTHNIGCIRGGSPGRLWRQLRVSATAGGYNVYPSYYVGQRAHIRLIYDLGYNSLLARHDWDTFALRYYGPGYPASYVRSLRVAHERINQMARARGLHW